MSEIPSLSEQQIRQRVGDESFRRGREYSRSGAIFDARRQGVTLKARCEGSRAEPYRLSVTFDGQGVVVADCSCPVGGGGACKHLAALLLAWLHKPAEFRPVKDLDTTLERRSKEELIALVKQMLCQRPDLETLLETPLPGARRVPVQQEVYRRQAAAVFRRGYDWGAAVDIAEELLAITAIGDGFVQQGDYASAAAVYTAVAEEVLEGYELYDDAEGELAGVVAACVDGLGSCLADEQDHLATREAILKTLFAVYRFDVSYGGVGLSDEVPGLVLEHATAAEQGAVAGWVREALSAVPAEKYSSWRSEQYGGFLLGLEADTLDYEAFLQVCRETGRTGDLVDRLLALGRVDDAVGEAQQAGDHRLLQLAAIFVDHGQGDLAGRLMAERSRATEDPRIAGWLKDHYHARGDATAALEFAERAFRLRPGLEGYQDLRGMASPLGRWEELRLALLNFLSQHEHTGLLVRVYLAEGEIDKALEGVGLLPAYPYYGGSKLRLEVAGAAEASRPRAALEIYQQQVEALIALRARGHYQEACRLLTRVRALCEQLGEAPRWASYIGALRERHRSLRALKEELALAGL